MGQLVKSFNFFLANSHRFENYRNQQIRSRQFRLDISQVATACSAAVSIPARRNELSLRAGRERPTPVTRFPGLQAEKTRGGCERYSTVTKGNHHRSGGTETSSGHKLSKSRRYFAKSFAK